MRMEEAFSFSYDSAGHLTRISYPDNKSTEVFLRWRYSGERTE